MKTLLLVVVSTSSIFPAASLKALQEMVSSLDTLAATPFCACLRPDSVVATILPTGTEKPTEESPSPVLMTMATVLALEAARDVCWVGRAVMIEEKSAAEPIVRKMDFILITID